MPDTHLVSQAPLTPVADDEQIRRRRKFWLRSIWIAVAGTLIALICVLMNTAAEMVDLFDDLPKTGETNPGTLAGEISFLLLNTVQGLVPAAIAFLVLIGVLIRFFTLPKLSANPPEK